ncbi:sodium:solute symporter family protein [Haliea sp. E17]|uniref:sodium:solute symporter family protein n=1 Tax=Haliea sp. E17 TaxID=3401576 RepID=UPI003AABC31E
MNNIDGDLLFWSWGFLLLYIGGMLLFGYLGQRRVRNADDFATARGGYGPLFLAFAFSATTASGATFIGIPGIAYTTGLSAMWVLFLYPVGVYVGVWLCMTMVARGGAAFGSRSIPEYLGDRYQSEFLRLLVACFSLLLFFYLAGQLVSCLVLFQWMLGLPPAWAIAITCGVLLVYVMAGGAHADILTDGVQGMLMLLLALLVLVLFFTGYGVPGGLPGVVERLRAQGPELVGALNPDSALVNSWWSVACLAISTVPLGLLPHLGNKLWALRQDAQRSRFLVYAFAMGLTLPAIGLGGLLARAIFGDDLLAAVGGSNQAIPALFIELFPTWMAALLGVGVLAAVMSTADGLIISSSQVVANDIYRCSIAPRIHRDWSGAAIEARTLLISRWATLGTLLLSAMLAWKFLSMNVLLLVWVGLGGFMAALAGPLILGVLWRGTTTAGAISGFIAGAVAFIILHSGLIDARWFAPGALQTTAAWLQQQAPNPYTCAVLGEIMGIVLTALVSLVSVKLPTAHLEEVFG